MGVKRRTVDRLHAISEKQFLSLVIELATWYGWKHYHTLRSIGSDPGFPDLVLVKPKRIIFAELKSEKGKLTSEQCEWIELLANSGVEVYVWRPSDWDKIVQVLSGYKIVQVLSG